MKKILLLTVSLLILSCNGNYQSEDYLNLKDKLAGKWKANAFSGELQLMIIKPIPYLTYEKHINYTAF